MDIRVGAPPPVGDRGEKVAGNVGAIEAKVLAVRTPRKREQGPRLNEDRRRGAGTDRDPLTGRVMLLLIPDGSRLPDGIESGAYRVFLRFVKR